MLSTKRTDTGRRKISAIDVKPSKNLYVQKPRFKKQKILKSPADPPCNVSSAVFNFLPKGVVLGL